MLKIKVVLCVLFFFLILNAVREQALSLAQVLAPFMFIKFYQFIRVSSSGLPRILLVRWDALVVIAAWRRYPVFLNESKSASPIPLTFLILNLCINHHF